MSLPVLTTLPLPALTTDSIFALSGTTAWRTLGNITFGGTGGFHLSGSGAYGSTLPGSTYVVSGGGAGTNWASHNNYTIQNNITGISGGVDPSLKVQSGGLLEVTGEKADILINGVSLKETLDNINARLGMMRPNPKIEAEWDELLELGERYRALQADIKDKMQMWDLLKKEY
jgi:hypothetical protein